MKKIFLLLLLMTLTLVACNTKETSDPSQEKIDQAIGIIELLSPLNALVIEEDSQTEKVRVVTEFLQNHSELKPLGLTISVSTIDGLTFVVTLSKETHIKSVNITVSDFIVETVDHESIVDEAIRLIESSNTYPTIEVTDDSEEAYLKGIIDYLSRLDGMDDLRVILAVTFNPEHWNYQVEITRGDVTKSVDFNVGDFRVVKPVIDPFLYILVDAVRDHFGEDYAPSSPIGEQQLNEMYGLSSEWMVDFYAEGPMWTMAVDLFIGISVKEGHIDDVVEALNNYREYLINDSFQYPMNMPKVEASKVHVMGDYAFLILLSAPFDGADEDAKAFYESINETAIVQINSAYNN